MKKLILLSLLYLITLPTSAQTTHTLTTNWKGTIDIPGKKLSFQTHFEKESDSLSGNITIQGVSLPLQKIRTTDKDSVFFAFTTSINVAKFKGTFNSDSTINGQFRQAGYSFPFNMTRYDAKRDTLQPAAADTSQAARPPYYRKDLIIKNDSIDIGGTLTWPKKTETDKLVIMISGSGAQDRDETMTPVSDFKPFALLAHSLTGAGIATFRYDDRGIGQSTGNFGQTTLDMLASDVEAIITEFTDGSGPNFDAIILLGHSQGGIIGGKVAAENNQVDKLVLMASPGLTLKEVSDFQVRAAMRQAGLNKKQTEQEMAARNRLISALKRQNNVSQAKQKYINDHLKTLQNLSNSTISSEKLQKSARQETKRIVAGYSNPQFKSFLFYDPTQDLEKLPIPVLVLLGGKDTQVTVDMNKAPIKEALEKADAEYKIKVFKHANHPFQKAKTGQVEEYNALPNSFVDGFASTLVTWIKQVY